jgi:hypothetical protein
MFLRKRGFSVLGVTQVVDRKTGLRQAAAHRVGDQGIVFDYEYSHGQGWMGGAASIASNGRARKRRRDAKLCKEPEVHPSEVL